MKTNVVLADRTVRMGLGMLLLASPLLELPTYPFNLLGLVLIVTAAIGYCPLYAVLFSFKPNRTAAPPSRQQSRHETIQTHSSAH